ncbi:thiosulfate oxidation carrier complex protein SoxZ [Halomonas sp. TRM85114]|uniref:thiosulfate oxidation carrier complex protein SoxZ n=1 Tax=Halomonas jincaotanensis TaxID=2810616 RepID=UPI001BD3849E|nr:thiosulfate oxidation carrier complex protein SoxZ [Halomonas jincaotanensis]MBS9405677.1 thiosulfate oxidation carrier complex protein SoxZ [Halomonas jincaotanensis]
MPTPLPAITRRRLIISIGLLVISPLALADGPWLRLEAASNIVGDTQPNTAGLHLDLPHVSEDGSAVPLGLSFDGTLGEDDYLTDIHLFATGNPNPEIAVFHLTPMGGLPEISTRVRLNETQEVIAVARSHRGETFATSREVRITVSGCLMRGNDDQPAALSYPRVSAPSHLAPGEAGEIRTLINHPMETGLREGPNGNTLPRHIIEHFRVTLAGETAFEAELHRSISANPYLRFHLTPTQGGELVIEWQDDSGESAIHRTAIDVG